MNKLERAISIAEQLRRSHLFMQAGKQELLLMELVEILKEVEHER
jgi:hypothetical protein